LREGHGANDIAVVRHFAINWAGRTRFTGALYRTAWGWRID
jgi:hypothetical protein